MNIEQDVFNKAKCDFSKLPAYGFIENENGYSFMTYIMEGAFRVDILIQKDGAISGKLWDVAFDDEYTNFRIIGGDGFTNKVRLAYESILLDIKEKCFTPNCYDTSQANALVDYIGRHYGDHPSFEWKRYPGISVFRNHRNHKWYAFFVKTGYGGTESLYLRLPEKRVKELLAREGICKSTFLKATAWIIIPLEYKLTTEEIIPYLQESHDYIDGQNMLIKDYYDLNYIKRINRQITNAYPPFNGERFVSYIQERLADQSYTEKMNIIAEGLHSHLPDYLTALEVFHAMLGEKMSSMKEMYDVGMPYAPFGKFIEKYAVENEDCFEKTMTYIYELTQRYTGEFAMRPLLAAFPERTVAVIKRWTDDESDRVRRLCSECMRIAIPWASKLNFALEHFEDYCSILIKLATDDCEYVRRSVANNLNELCKADTEKAKILIGQLNAIEDKRIKSIITHGTRWARLKKGINFM